jgi:phosphate-selective porin OprO/OprP
MRWICIWALLATMVTGLTYGQQTAPRGDDLPPDEPSSRGAPQQADAGAKEIQNLQATLAQIKDRLSHLEQEKKEQRPLLDPQPVSVPFSPADDNKHCGFDAAWENGLWISTRDNEFRFHAGGLMQVDFGWNRASQAVMFGSGGTGQFQDGATFRRARIRLEGTIYSHIEYLAEFDFANTIENDASSSNQQIGSPSFSEVWVTLTELPFVGNFRVGWIKEPMGFEYLTSARWLNFMERPPGTSSFFLRSPGVMLFDTAADERVTWAIAFYHVQNDNFGFGIGDGEYGETGRITCLPWYEEDGQELLHLGVGASHRHLDNNQVSLKGRPSVRSMPGSIEPALAATGTVGGTTQDMVNLELASVLGRWTIQSEYYASFIHDALVPNQPPPTGVQLGTLFYQGAYVEVLYFLTGEYRAYDRKKAVFNRVIPLRNFDCWSDSWTCGAWQIGARYSYLDLQNKGVNGATLNDVVLGLNWFLNPNMKVQWNLAIDHRSPTPTGSEGWTYIFGTRFSLDF